MRWWFINFQKAINWWLIILPNRLMFGIPLIPSWDLFIPIQRPFVTRVEGGWYLGSRAGQCVVQRPVDTCPQVSQCLGLYMYNPPLYTHLLVLQMWWVPYCMSVTLWWSRFWATMFLVTTSSTLSLVDVSLVASPLLHSSSLVPFYWTMSLVVSSILWAINPLLLGIAWGFPVGVNNTVLF